MMQFCRPLPMNRRSLLTTLPALAVAACANPAQAQTDLDLIAAFAQGVGPVVVAANPSSAGTVSTVVADIVAVDKTLAGVVTSATPQSTVAQITTDVEALAPIAIAALPTGSTYVLAAQAALALLPAIERAAGLTGAIAAPVTGMDEAAARTVLRGLR